ncbi:hypothetical protein D3C78_1278470 [compost metagenome]
MRGLPRLQRRGLPAEPGQCRGCLAGRFESAGVPGRPQHGGGADAAVLRRQQHASLAAQGLLLGTRQPGQPGCADGADARAGAQDPADAQRQAARRDRPGPEPQQHVPAARRVRRLCRRAPERGHAAGGHRPHRCPVPDPATLAGGRCAGGAQPDSAERQRGRADRRLGSAAQPPGFDRSAGRPLAVRAPVPRPHSFCRRRAGALLPVGAFAHAKRPADRPDCHAPAQRPAGHRLLLPADAGAGRDRA